MKASINKLLAALRRHIWFLAAFFIPLAIRSIPEILSWPYPLGYDTINMVGVITPGTILISGPLFFLKSQLFYTFETLLYWATGNFVVTIKIFGPLLMALVSVLMFLYAKRGLSWSNKKSFFVSFLLAIYFVSLRNSWDLYAQSFGLIFLFASLVILKSSKSPKRFIYACVLMLLTVYSHQLVSVILFFIISLESLRFLSKRLYKDFLYSFVSLSVAGVFFLFRVYSPVVGSVIIPSNAASEPPFAFAWTLTGLLIYAYGLLLPFVVAGLVKLKDWVLRFWIVWCLGAMFLLIAFPSLPLYYWPRWFYLLVYPLLFFAVEGLDRFVHISCNKHKVKRIVPKVLAITYVTLLLALSGFYLVSNPENQISFFADSNPYLVFIPSSMLQNMISISDNPSLVNCFEWINSNVGKDSAVVMHYALFDLARIYIHGPPIIDVVNSPSIYNHLQNQTSLVDGMISASASALDAGNTTVYTVWWTDGNGWYDIPTLPSNFKLLYQSGEMAVYAYNPVT